MPTPASPAAGTSVRFGGLTTRYLVLGSEAGSAAVLEHVLEPGRLGAPPHRHRHEDEISIVLDGQLTVLHDGEIHALAPGATIVKRRGSTHTFWNAGDTPVRFLEILAPVTGFERYFAEIAPLVPDGRPPDLPALSAVAERHGLEVDFAGAGELSRRYGVAL